MNKIVFPVAAAAILLLTTSCGEDKSGTSFEVVNANFDENVNPATIRGYEGEEPGMPGAPKNPSQYYPFNTRMLPEATRQELEGGNIAVQMVTVYYSASRSLNDLAKEYSNPAAPQGGTLNSPADTGGNNNSGQSTGGSTSGGNNSGQTTGGNTTQNNGGNSNNATQNKGSGNTTNQQ